MSALTNAPGMRLRILAQLLPCFLVASVPSPVNAATERLPHRAIGFENDFSSCASDYVQQDVTAEVTQLDGSYAPRATGCVVVDYFATGSSAGYLDAVSLRFEVPELAGSMVVTSAKLRMYVMKGSYSDGSWHAVKLYPGAMSRIDQDCDSYLCWTAADQFPGTPNWEGWIERPVPTSWFTTGGLDLTARIWNARIDAVALVFDVMPVEPGAVGRPIYAAGFEDDYAGCGGDPVVQDAILEVSARDAVFAPRLETCVFVDYFATGGSQGWLDGVALRFDLTPFPGVAAATLRVYLRKGTYGDARWHALKIYPGLFNTQDEDCDAYSCWNTDEEFPGTEAWEGWVERQVPAEWLAGTSLDLTMRIWNASIDAVELLPLLATRSRTGSWGVLKLRYR